MLYFVDDEELFPVPSLVEALAAITGATVAAASCSMLELLKLPKVPMGLAMLEITSCLEVGSTDVGLAEDDS